ncbi:hypothetical protein E4U25_000812 [Claviceps purpurea]|nr:hypothetical protein E4U25_000812 [Claviceps purpurea]KAG6245479.1 hypothetical protein E4U23_005352 [Claviceps purpurea]
MVGTGFRDIVAQDIALGARDAVTAVIPFIRATPRATAPRLPGASCPAALKRVNGEIKRPSYNKLKKLVSSLQSPATPSVYVLRLQWPGLLRVSLVGRFERT